MWKNNFSGYGLILTHIRKYNYYIKLVTSTDLICSERG